MGEDAKKKHIEGLPESAKAELGAGDIQDAPDAADVKGGIRAGERLGKRLNVRKIRDVRNFRKIGGFDIGNTWRK